MAKAEIIIKSIDELKLMRESALLVSKTLGEIAKIIGPGVTTQQINDLGDAFIRDHGAYPAFLGMYDFPKSLCISPNEQVVHGIPNDKPLQEGDIVSVDCGVYMNGFYGDHAYSFKIGEVSPEVDKLLKVTKESLYAGIRQFKKGNRLGDICHAIQIYNEKEGYGVVRELCGHGLGRDMHEEPQVPNYGRRGTGKVLKDGMVLAIEPMINMGTKRVRFHKDGWTVTSKDNSYSAHFEHDVTMIDGKPRLLSTFQYIYDALGIESDEEKEFLFDDAFVD